ncbi:hypothetical protein CYMTET_22729 [Cymbomonas tetramitiformis]|uniref:ABC transporter domain-containing protein n=2 Tax=Cymbomonas tetramitiformis TaxID=36881 RepID=A0AAE0G065_9CHLO|nr:hypothetical protein CYMTET_22729 [Cymbomonas tetramitiformis]
MGPSGAGKTSLLEILGNQTVEGEVTGELPDLEAEELAFVTQEDVLEPTSTVLETLLFYAMLRLPPMRSRDYRRRAEEIMGVLGLTPLMDQMVGGSSDLTMMKTLSGGQRRRVSIGCALMIDPKVIMLDEPTSGLDPFTALTVVECLLQLTKNGLTCVCSIHQPRIDIFKKFHQVMFLCQGLAVYAGPPTGDELSAAGFRSILTDRDLTRVNPADLIADWLTVMTDSDLEALAQTYEEKFSQKKIPKVERRKLAGGSEPAAREGPPVLLRFKVLARREFKAKVLTYHSASRIGSMALWGIMFGIPYVKIGYALKSTQSFDRIRGLYAIALFNASLTHNGSPVMEYYVLQSKAEMGKGLYKPLESLIVFFMYDVFIVLVPSGVLLTVEMLLMGSFYDKLDKILYVVTIGVLEHCNFSILLLIISVLIPKNPTGMKLILQATTPIFTGFMIPIDQIVWPVRIFAYLSPLHLTFAGAMNSMFAGQSIECDDSDDPDCEQGDDVLKSYGILDDQPTWYEVIMIAIAMFITYLLIVYYIMRRQYISDQSSKR